MHILLASLTFSLQPVAIMMTSEKQKFAGMGG